MSHETNSLKEKAWLTYKILTPPLWRYARTGGLKDAWSTFPNGLTRTRSHLTHVSFAQLKKANTLQGKETPIYVGITCNVASLKLLDWFLFGRYVVYIFLQYLLALITRSKFPHKWCQSPRALTCAWSRWHLCYNAWWLLHRSHCRIWLFTFKVIKVLMWDWCKIWHHGLLVVDY